MPKHLSYPLATELAIVFALSACGGGSSVDTTTTSADASTSTAGVLCS